MLPSHMRVGVSQSMCASVSRAGFACGPSLPRRPDHPHKAWLASAGYEGQHLLGWPHDELESAGHQGLRLSMLRSPFHDELVCAGHEGLLSEMLLPLLHDLREFSSLKNCACRCCHWGSVTSQRVSGRKSCVCPLCKRVVLGRAGVCMPA